MTTNLVSVGRFTYGHEKLTIREWGEGATLTIGSFCSIAKGSTVYLGGNHRVDWITTYPFGHINQKELGGRNIKGHPTTNGNVVIGNDVWIGSGVTIMSGITIGSGAVIAAHSNVTKDVQPYEIVGGNPAKHIRFRFPENIQSLLLQLKWWDLPTEDIVAITQELSSVPSEDLIRSLIKRTVRD